jgi:predicted amidohydrolase YtcJ
MRHCFSLLAILVAVALAQDAIAADLALTHARIYAAPDADPVADGTLLIHDGRIQRMGPASAVKLPSTTRVIDLR